MFHYQLTAIIQNTPMTGIGFNLILIRTAEKKAQEKLATQQLPILSTMRFNVPAVKTMEDPTSSYSESTAVWGVFYVFLSQSMCSLFIKEWLTHL